MRILFIDHAFHKKTKSGDFFLSILRRSFQSIDVEYVDVESQCEVQVLNRPKAHDLVVLWQLDFLATAFLDRGYPTIVVPMYDGSAALPMEHWVAINDASIICFSRTLYERVSAAGCRAFLCKYFLPPCDEAELPEFEKLNAFLWLRRPQDGITPRFVEEMIGARLSSIHVHNAPDDARVRQISGSDLAPFSVTWTESRWSSSKRGYDQALNRCNVFISPRLSEGIGIAALEGMSKGMLVLANDDAVCNEYIANWVSGILFRVGNTGTFDLSLAMAKDMAYLGWRGASEGYRQWLDSIPGIVEFMGNTTNSRLAARRNAPDLFQALWDAYHVGPDLYRRFLLERLIASKEAETRAHSPMGFSLLKWETRESPCLSAEGLFFGLSGNCVGKVCGLGNADAFSADVAANTVSFSVRRRGTHGEAPEVSLVVEGALKEDLSVAWEVVVHINQRIALRTALPQKKGALQFQIPIIDVHSPELAVIMSFLVSGERFELDEPPPVSLFCVRLKNALS